MSAPAIGEEIGRIVRLQVQVRSLKVPGPKHRAYDPGGIVAVPRLLLEEVGATGVTEDGTRVQDIHHREHPKTRNRFGNEICFGFTSHYSAMRARMPLLVDGMAGENLLIESDRMWDLDALFDGLVIVTGSGPVVLEDVEVAKPCPEFARYALQFPETARPDQRVIDAVRFLDGGVRGFYATCVSDLAEVNAGDRVHLAKVEPRDVWPW